MSSSDDAPIGQILTRRELLASFGAAGVALLSHGSTRKGEVVAPAAVCVVRPAQVEGPYFVDEKLERSDIRSDPATRVLSPGTPLLLTFRVSRLLRGLCAPLAGATVDIWHCDALGIYSDERDEAAGFDSRGKKFLRGYQTTSRAGLARFVSIYPGWYEGRAVHVHFKIRTAGASGTHHDFTSQLYFNDTLTDRVHARAPYATKGKGRLPNAADDIFREQHGPDLILNTTRRGGGYAAIFDVAVSID
ncbi:MAG: intradiol ring-cleavage dioxygenase [Gemmatimonadales bacterium]